MIVKSEETALKAMDLVEAGPVRYSDKYTFIKETADADLVSALLCKCIERGEEAEVTPV